ncbi:MAG: outer membrane beta-barrel protein [Bacteroidales bacterium]|nr:outer membrane beta-barrel protein [Bacteroidales bacterium]
MKNLLIYLFLITTYVLDFAQSIQSTVKDSAQNPIMFANVAVLNKADSSLVIGTTTDSTGKFVLNTENPQNKFVIISFVGYKSYSADLKDLKSEVILDVDDTFLQTVEVKSTRQIVTLEDNKLKYDADAIREKKIVVSAFDLIKELPSVVSNDGENLTIVGTQASALLINGRVSTMSYDNLINYLKTLPADKVENVEISYNAPAEWNVRGSAINVILKKERHYSYSGQIGARYRNQSANTFGTTASAFFASPKWNIDLSYDNAIGTGKNRMVTDVHHNVLGNIFDIHSDSYSKTKGSNHNIYSSVTYNIDDYKSLNLSYFGTYVPNQTQQGFSENSYTGNSESDNDIENTLHDISLHYDHGKSTPEQILSFNAGAEYTNYNNDYTQKMQYSEYSTDGVTLLPPYDAFSYNANQHINKVMGYLNINNSLPNGWSLAYGGRYTYTENKNRQTNIDLSQFATDNYKDTTLITEHSVRAFVSVRKSFLNNRLNLDATLTDEYYNNDGYEINDLLPDFTLSYMYNIDHILQLHNYTFRVHPSYWQLQDYTTHSDKYSIAKGNPYLRPDISNTTYFNYIFKQKYVLTVGYLYSKDNLVQQDYFLPDTLLKLRQTLNIEKTRLAFFNLSFPVEIGKRVTSRFQGNVRWQQYKSNDWFSLSFDTRYVQFTATNSTDIIISYKPKIILSLFVDYHSHGFAAMREYNGEIAADVSLRSEFLDGRLICNLSLNDIFESRYGIYYCNKLGQKYEMNSNFYNRYFRCEIAYKFKGYKQREKKQVDTSRFGM